MKKLILPLILILLLTFSANCFATAWDVSTAVYTEKSKDISSQETDPFGVTFSSDGSKMYIVGSFTSTVYQYTLSTEWDVSTATYAEKSKSVMGQDPFAFGVDFNLDGSKMYIVGDVTDTVYQYTLSTSWDVSTATYANKSYFETQDMFPFGVAFSSDGSKMYIVGSFTSTVYQYTLSTEWDVSTATYAEKSKDVSSQDTEPYGMTFSLDGGKMYIAGAYNEIVYQYTLSTDWDVSTASYANKFKDISSQDTAPKDVHFSPDGTKMYIMGAYNDTVYQYSLLAPLFNTLFFGTNL